MVQIMRALNLSFLPEDPLQLLTAGQVVLFNRLSANLAADILGGVLKTGIPPGAHPGDGDGAARREKSRYAVQATGPVSGAGPGPCRAVPQAVAELLPEPPVEAPSVEIQDEPITEADFQVSTGEVAVPMMDTSSADDAAQKVPVARPARAVRRKQKQLERRALRSGRGAHP
jgi:hypothetical protein